MNNIDNKLSNHRGRIFGLRLKDGRKINARMRKMTRNYVVVFDNNAREERKFAKTSIAGLNGI